jgi:hypothetical protein
MEINKETFVWFIDETNETNFIETLIFPISCSPKKIYNNLEMEIFFFHPLHSL